MVYSLELGLSFELTSSYIIHSFDLYSKMCPVNVHWHLGTEHYSKGEYDEEGRGPVSALSSTV